MSTRYLWDKYNVIYGNKQTVEKTEYSIDLDGREYDGAFYFSTGIKTAADGSYTLTGTVLNAISASHAETYVYTSASTYRYGAKYKTGNTSYIENTEASSAYWCFQVSSPGNYKYVGEAVLRQDASSFAPQYAFSAYELSKTKGPTKIGTVSSANSDAYPQDGVSGSNWYVYNGSASIDPLSVTYSTNEPDRGETVTAIVEPQATQGGEFSWQQTTLPTDAACMGVAYGNGKFISPAYGGGSYAYSTDGTTWANGTMPYIYFADIAFGGNKFLAVARSKRLPESKLAAYTTDGTSWVETAIPESSEYEWHSVAYGGGKFVVASAGIEKSGAAYTTDGINWGSSLLPSAGSWRVAYGAGKFVAVKYNSNAVAYSTDGTAWASAALPVAANWRAIAYGAGKFVAVAINSNVCACSADGITWTSTTLPSSADWLSIAFGGEKFVVAATGKTAQSVNGIDWDEVQTPEIVLSSVIGYGGGKFVVLPGTNSTKALYSSGTEPTPGTISYLYQYSTDGGQTWTTAGNATTDTQKGITVPESAEQFMVRVQASDDIGFTSTTYVSTANITVQIMRLWVGVDNSARKGTKLWVGVDGVARRVVRAWVGDENGTARRWF